LHRFFDSNNWRIPAAPGREAVTTAAIVFVLANLGNTLALQAKPKTGFAQVNNVEIDGHRAGRGAAGQFVKMSRGAHS
jgi:hypothetical protein